MKDIMILPNVQKDIGLVMTRSIVEFLEDKEIKVFLPLYACKELGRMDLFLKDEDMSPNFLKCFIVLGGDGTILSTARKMAHLDIPILGVNFGRLGYLADVEEEKVFEALDKLIKDEYVIEKRIMLEGKIKNNDRTILTEVALNDIVISRGSFTRMVDLSLYINEKLVDSFPADGMIISTPTGSTAYNLSAGGPIVSPETEVMILTSICPHSLGIRSIVVSKNEKISIKIKNETNKDTYCPHITVDGQVGYALEYNSVINIYPSKFSTKLVKISDYNFYDILRKKMFNIRK